MYVTYLVGSVRTMRFGLKEAHGKGQALQFNYLLEKGGFVFRPEGGEGLSVDFGKIRGAVASLCREILTIQANGDKRAAAALLDKYGVNSPAVEWATRRLVEAGVPIDIEPEYAIE